MLLKNAKIDEKLVNFGRKGKSPFFACIKKNRGSNGKKILKKNEKIIKKI